MSLLRCQNLTRSDQWLAFSALRKTARFELDVAPGPAYGQLPELRFVAFPFLYAAFDPLNHEWSERGGNSGIVNSDPRKSDTVEDKGCRLHAKLEGALLTLEPLENVVDVEYELSLSVLAAD